MGLFGALFGHPIVHRAKNSQAVSDEVFAAVCRERGDGDYDVGVRHGANERLLTFETYADYNDASRAANALADHYGVGVSDE